MASEFERAKHDYAARRDRAEAAAVHRRCADGPLYDVVPLGVERSGARRGKPVDPDSKAQCTHEYGLDREGRVAVARIATSLVGQFYEEFYDYADGRVFGARYGYATPKAPVNVSRLSLENGRPASYELYGGFGASGETYEYDGPRLTRIRAWQQEHGGARAEHEIEIERDDLGLPTSIEAVHPNGYRKSLYRVEPKPRSLKTLGALVEDLLVEAVVRAVARARVEEPAYCVALAYDGAVDGMLPPVVGVGLESERAAWRAAHGAGAKDYVWNPAEFATYDTSDLMLADDDVLTRACAAANAEGARAGDASVARKALTRAASRLGEREWTGMLEVTPDFVVYATDFELADLAKNLKASVPAERLAALRAEGLL